MSTINGEALTVEIDPHATLPDRYLGSDEDGPQYGPVSLYDAIVSAAADRLVRQIEKDAKAEVVERIGDAAAALIGERLPGIIDDALTGEIKVTDDWGHETSKGTLREMIVKHAQSELTVSGRGSYSRETELDKAVKEHIGSSLNKELAEAVAAAKRKLLTELTEQTSEALSKAIYNGVVRDRA